MRYRPLVYASVGWMICSTASGSVPAPERYIAYSGSATLRHSARFAYGEHHSLLLRGGRLSERVVLYTCADGSAFARKTLSYGDVLAPDFALEDASNGMREELRSGASGRVVMFRASSLDAEHRRQLPPLSGLVADAGFDEFIRAHWQSLLAQGHAPISFLVPSRGESMLFRIEALREAQIEGRAAELFRLRLGGVLGWVLPGIDVAYDVQDHWLLSYDGLSDLRDPAGDNFQVHVEFKPADRTPGDAELDRAMRAAPLAPCR